MFQEQFLCSPGTLWAHVPKRLPSDFGFVHDQVYIKSRHWKVGIPNSSFFWQTANFGHPDHKVSGCLKVNFLSYYLKLFNS